MIQIHRIHFANAVVLVLLLYLQTTPLEARREKSKRVLCPVGFQHVYNDEEIAMCFRKKGPETFADKFENCAGNRYSLKQHNNYDLPLSPQATWIDYKNLYDGGPYVDWSYTKDVGKILGSKYEVHRDSMYNVNEELCVVLDPVLNFTAVRCNEKHYRYCLVETYKDLDDTNSEDCEALSDPDLDSTAGIHNGELYPDLIQEFLQRKTYRFWSPIPTCLLEVVPQRGSNVRMTWSQSQQACVKRGGSLLSRGWRYSNFMSSFKNTSTSLAYPLGVQLSTNLTLQWYADRTLIPQSEWFFDKPRSNDTTLGAVLDESWELVNGSRKFFDVICEKTVPLRPVTLTLFIEDDGIILTVNDSLLSFNDIHCFTDSEGYELSKVSLRLRPTGKRGARLNFMDNGYYWCTHIRTEIFLRTESNKILKVRVEEDTFSVYAVKMTSLARDYDLKNIGPLIDELWMRKIEEYVFYSTKYRKTFGPSDSYDNHTIWNFKNNRLGKRVRAANSHKIKRVYLNSRSVLLHVQLLPDMLPVMPGQWEDINIDFMKPVYYCEKDEDLPDRLHLGETKRAALCKIYKCAGDFNEGVQLLITVEDTCYTPQPQNLNSSVAVTDITTETTTESSAADSTRLHKLSLELDSSDSSEEDDLYEPYVESKHPTTDTTTEGNDVTDSNVTEILIINTTTENSTGTTGESTTWNVMSTDKFTETARPPIYPPRPPSTPEPVVTATLPPIITTTPTMPPTYPPTTQPIPNAEQLEQVIADLNGLLNKTEPILVADIDDSFYEVDSFLAETDESVIPGNLLHVLDKLGARLDLNGSNNESVVRDNLALLVADARPSLPVKGLKISTRKSDVFTPEAFEFLRDDIENVHLMSDNNEVVVELPDSVAATYRRISFVVFRNDRAFQTSHLSVNSRVLSINIENTTEFHNGEVIDIYLTPLKKNPDRNESRTCAFWKFPDDDSSGNGTWSQDGCTFIRSTMEGMLDTCRCTHLTHFAEVLVPRTVFSERSENALEVISIVGCVTSIIGLILVGVTAILFRSWRRDFSNKVWLQLCISIFIMSLSYIVIVSAHFEEYDVMCMLTGIVLHFSVLSSFCWMLVSAVLSYRKLVTVFTIDASHKLLRASAFAWGVPCAVVGILLSVAPHSYSGRFDDKNPTAAFCYPSGLALWLSVFAPLALMLVANWTLFALIVRSVFASRRNHPNRIGNRHSGDKNEALRCASVSFFLVFLFGLPWLLGLFAMNIVMAYFFVILSTFQGFVLFLFFVLGNKKTRDLWLNKLKIKQTRKIPVTSSTYTNNRSTAGIINSRSTNQPETIETKISKPRSLVSLDDSRFS